MNDFYPFIYEPEKKEDFELIPLYIELVPPPCEKTKDDDEHKVIIIEIL